MAVPILHAHQLPDLLGNEPGQLRLMTIRSEGQFNTVVYEDYDLYRGVEDRLVILIHPMISPQEGLDLAKPVTVHGPAGSLCRCAAASVSTDPTGQHGHVLSGVQCTRKSPPRSRQQDPGF